MNTSNSHALFLRAQRSIPGGVNSPVRAFRSVGIDPIFLKRGEDAHVWDADGNKYIDYVGSWGPLILGHSHPKVVEAIQKQASIATSFGAPTELEIELAELVKELMPSIDLLRMTSSGTEATMSALRLARGFTGREKIIKFEGCYHGHGDSFLIKAGSGALTLGAQSSPGVTQGTAKDTMNANFNDLPSVENLISANRGEIAAIIVEPIAHNSPSILPAEGFLEGLRAICDGYGTLLIFDEIITGFRHALGGYQAICGVTPDLSTFAKAIANGYPMAAVAGRRVLLERLNTTAAGDVTFAGTYNGGAISMAAALATIDVLETEPVHEHLFRLGDRMRDGLRSIAADLDVPAVVSGYGSLYVMLFMEGPLESYDDVVRNDRELFVAYRQELVRRGVLEMPENIGRNHIMFSHTDADIDTALEVSQAALTATLRRRGHRT